MHAILATLVAMTTFTPVSPAPICELKGACAVAPTTVYVTTDGRFGSALDTIRRHELGHIFDYNFMDDEARNRFRSIMRDPRPWRSPPNSPHEQFAEAFETCVRSVRYPRSAGSAYDYVPTTRQHGAVCGMIQRQYAK